MCKKSNRQWIPVIPQRNWQEDKCIEDSEMAALRWLDNPESNIDVNLIEDVIIPLNIDKAGLILWWGDWK